MEEYSQQQLQSEKEKVKKLREMLECMTNEGYDAYDNAHHLTVQRWLEKAEQTLKETE